MEPIRRPQDITPPRQTLRGQTPPVRSRPFVNDFAPVRPTSPTPMTSPQPLQSVVPIQPSPTPVINSVTEPLSPSPTPTDTQSMLRPLQASTTVSTPSTSVTISNEQSELLSPPSTTPPPNPDTNMDNQTKDHHALSRSSLIGLIVVIILLGIALSPVFKGKILENFPGSSNSFSTGNQSIACISTPTNQITDLSYDSRNGFPLVYSYQTTTTLIASCNGKTQTVVSGHTSQFNPLAGGIDIVLALLIGFSIAKILRKVSGNKHRY